jgi:hypothetical protein
MTQTGIRKDPDYMEKYSADYYLKNRQRLLDYRKDYYQKHKDRYKKLTQTRLEKISSDVEYKKDISKKLRAWKDKCKLSVQQILGIRCILCGSTRGRMEYHEIHGKPHTGGFAYILKHIQDFVPLCWKCHRTIHFFNVMKDKERAKELIEKLGE